MWRGHAWHHTERYANKCTESDHGRLKFRLRPMCGLKNYLCCCILMNGCSKPCLPVGEINSPSSCYCGVNRVLQTCPELVDTST